MCKNELVKEVAKKMEISRSAAKEVIDCTFETIAEKLIEKEDVSVVGFGKFGVKQVESREFISGLLGEKVTVPEHYKLYFKPSADLKEQVR